MFAFQEVVVGGAYPSYGCCSIEYCASELDPVLESGLESVSLTETMYSVVVTVRTEFDSFSQRTVSPGQIAN